MSAPPSPRYLGAHVKRLEDPRLLAGEGRFLDDITLPGLLHAAFVRSTHAHAIIRALDGDQLKATWSELQRVFGELEDESRQR